MKTQCLTLANKVTSSVTKKVRLNNQCRLTELLISNDHKIRSFTPLIVQLQAEQLLNVTQLLLGTR